MSPRRSTSGSPFAVAGRVTRRLRRRLLLHRRALAALCAGLAVLVGLRAGAPAPTETVPVWTASHSLDAGAVVRGEDLVRTEFLPGSEPAGALGDPRRAIGRTLVSPVGRGEPLTERRLLGPGLLRGYPGRTAVPLRISDADVVPLLRVGDEIGVVVADPEGREPPRELVASAPVVAVPAAGRASAGTPGRLVVVAVPQSEASGVAAAAATGILIPVWND